MMRLPHTQNIRLRLRRGWQRRLDKTKLIWYNPRKGEWIWKYYSELAQKIALVIVGGINVDLRQSRLEGRIALAKIVGICKEMRSMSGGHREKEPRQSAKTER